MGSFARGCVSPVAISGGTQAGPRTGVSVSQPSLRHGANTFGTGALPSGHSRGVLVRCRGKGGRPAMAVTTGFQGRTFDVPRTCVPCIDPPRRAPCAAADAVFAGCQSLPLVQRSPADERERTRTGCTGVRSWCASSCKDRDLQPERGCWSGRGHQRCRVLEHESPAETASGTMQVVGLGCARHRSRRLASARCRAEPAAGALLGRDAPPRDHRDRLAGTTATPWKPPWYSTSSTWQRRRGVRCSSPAHRRACRHLVPIRWETTGAQPPRGSRSLDAD